MTGSHVSGSYTIALYVRCLRKCFTVSRQSVSQDVRQHERSNLWEIARPGPPTYALLVLSRTLQAEPSLKDKAKSLDTDKPIVARSQVPYDDQRKQPQQSRHRPDLLCNAHVSFYCVAIIQSSIDAIFCKINVKEAYAIDASPFFTSLVPRAEHFIAATVASVGILHALGWA